MRSFFVGQNNTLIMMCRVAAAVASVYAVWVSIKRDYPPKDSTLGRLFISAVLCSVAVLSLGHELEVLGAETYGDLISPAAALAYVAHVMAAFLFIRAARFRSTHLRPMASARHTEPPEEVIRLD
jgi:hypothetical protein